MLRTLLLMNSHNHNDMYFTIIENNLPPRKVQAFDLLVMIAHKSQSQRWLFILD